MEPVVTILSILGALLIGAISPGPSFILVARTSIALSRRDGLAAAFGMGIGGAVYAGLALLGLHAVLSRVEWLYFSLKLLGGLYLIYLAIVLWRGARGPIVVENASGRCTTAPGKSFCIGLATQLSNPKTAIFYGSVFAALLPAPPAGWMFAALLPLVFLVETAWYAAVALTFSSGRPRGAYLRSKVWIDRTAGSVMGVLGLKLIFLARPA